MLYEPLAKMVEDNKAELARRVAETVQERKLRLFQSFKSEQIVPRVTVPLEMIARYLRNGDPNEWRNYVAETSNYFRKRGYTADEVNAIGYVLSEKILEMMEEKMGGPNRAAERQRYSRRIEGLTTLAGISSINAHVKNKD
jgi:hypothetical protein